MISGSGTAVIEPAVLDERVVLDRARGACRARQAAELGQLKAAVDWAAIHSADTLLGPADGWHEQGLRVAGDGSPSVAEWAIVDFAAALGMSTDAGRHYVADAVELRYRLPLTYARTMTGEVDVWRARRIATQTKMLPPDVTQAVDREVHKVAQSITLPALQRLVERLVGDALDEDPLTPDEAPTFVHLDFDNVTTDGLVDLRGLLTLADAIDLEEALRAGAQDLTASGCTADLAQRRAMALGALGRIDVPLAFDNQTGAASIDASASVAVRGREVVIHTHVPAGGLTADVEKQRCDLGVDQLLRWTQLPATRVTIKPVIDLNQSLTTGNYAPSERLRELVALRDRVCVFPHCNRPARGCGLDHIIPFDPDGPPGQTRSDNLAALCRRHHRAKTTGHWTYRRLGPGLFYWHNARTGEQILTGSGGHTWPLPAIPRR